MLTFIDGAVLFLVSKNHLYKLRKWALSSVGCPPSFNYLYSWIPQFFRVQNEWTNSFKQVKQTTNLFFCPSGMLLDRFGYQWTLTFRHFIRTLTKQNLTALQIHTCKFLVKAHLTFYIEHWCLLLATATTEYDFGLIPKLF